jgi:catechol 2,3-dioxygenase-like lactoylglutathione lyase family enzyme
MTRMRQGRGKAPQVLPEYSRRSNWQPQVAAQWQGEHNSAAGHVLSDGNGDAMLTDCKVIAFVATKDPAQARFFFEQTLGLALVNDGPFAMEFNAYGTMLRVQKVAELSPARHTVLGWQVLDIQAEIAALVRKGVTFERYDFLSQDDRGVWTAPSGAKVAWFKDPDGNTLSLTQFE